ncbi:putative DNA helicase ino80 [Homalodisca vitripennis]|nr:putative DNA helicase ino80 [Homalodisca vitripennis]
MRTRQFGSVQMHPSEPADHLDEERPQPAIFKGTLKHYQLKGMNWLANLYDQGINGILADEMGLGKTVQSIAFLCHIAEKYSVWGPFLIISPASTLHNWQQEMARFVPDFKVVPYWGSPQERKILRQFWDQRDLHTQEASFHVVITSYQLVITDFKYFNRIKWQYLILDEAQAIKSTSRSVLGSKLIIWSLLNSSTKTLYYKKHKIFK